MVKGPELLEEVHFPQNYLAKSVAVVPSLPIGTEKVVIDTLFSTCLNCLSVGNEWCVQKHVPAESQGPRSTPKCRCHCGAHGMHFHRQSLINNIPYLGHVLRQIAIQQC